MRLRIIAVGKGRNDPLCTAADEYLARIARFHDPELIVVKEAPLKASTSVAKVKAEEADRIRRHLDPSDHVVALDERGKELTSVQMSEVLQRELESGRRSISFVIGGPSGLDPTLLREVDARWALSRLTLPHRMARLLLAEQLYRAFTISRGEPYHK